MQPITPPTRATLILLTGVTVLTLNMFLPSLTRIAADFGVDYAMASFAVAGYLAITAVINLIAGPLSDRYGRRPVVLGALVIYLFASIGCAFSSNIWMFLICRMFQAAIAAGATISMAIVRDTRTREDAASELGYIAMAMALAPMIGPMIGGVIDTFFGWRFIFYLYTACGLALLVLCWFDLGETQSRAAGPSSARAKSPALVLDPRFLAYALCTAFSTGAFFIFITGAPLIASVNFGFNATQIGLLVGSITGGFMCGSFVAGRFASSYPLPQVLVFGRLIACTALLFGLTTLALGAASPYLVFGCIVFVGFSNGLTMPSSNSGAISVRPEATGWASGLNAAINVLIGAILISISGYVLDASASPATLLTLMLISALSALSAAIWAKMQEQKAP